MPTGTVKFFNPAKGFGFIAPDEGGADVFVHISAVQNAGMHELNDGDTVTFELERDRKTGKASAVDLVLVAASPPQRRAGPGSFSRERRGAAPERAPRSPGPTGGSGHGLVKWFNPTKGFGFIQPADGGADVFVHISAVERSGLSALNEGQSVAYDLEQDRRSGKTSAVNLRFD